MNYDRMLNKSVTNLKPSGIRKYFDLAATMEDVLSLGVGEPDFQTPWHIRQTAISSLEKGLTRYSTNTGSLELRKSIASYLKRRFDLCYCPDNEIIVTVGASEAIDLCIRLLVEQGDEVIIPEPCFVCYEPLVALAKGKPVPVATTMENQFRLTVQQLAAAITDKTKLLILSYPNNPTGAVMEKEDLEKLIPILIEHNIMVLSDEIYAELNYTTQKHVSIASLDGMKERTVVIGGFSKSYSMTGWRLGYACGPKEILMQMAKVHQYAIMSAPTTSQYAGIEALDRGDDDVARMREDYDMRRRFITNGFNKLGLTCFEPMGAFYVFPCIKSTGMTSDEFCEKLLFTKKVAVVPGNAFGRSGEGFIRVSYCYSIGHIKEALRRIEELLEEIKSDC